MGAFGEFLLAVGVLSLLMLGVSVVLKDVINQIVPAEEE